MSANSSWVPDEDSQTLFSERCRLQGVFVSTLAYGINVCLYFMTLHYLTRSQNRMELKRSLPVVIYITTLFGLATIFMVSLVGFTQMTFIDDRNYPGGPNAFEDNEFSIPLDDAGNVAFVVINWLCDALMVRMLRSNGLLLTFGSGVAFQSDLPDQQFPYLDYDILSMSHACMLCGSVHTILLYACDMV